MKTLPFVTILMLAFSSNLDNIGIGVSYGIRKISIPFTSNLLIASITSCGTLLSLLLGKSVYLFLSPRAASLWGGVIIIAAGIWVIFQQAVMQRAGDPRPSKPASDETRIGSAGSPLGRVLAVLDNPILADRDSSGVIDLKEATALAFGLTINNLPNGIGAGMLGLSPTLMTSAVFVTSIATIWAGMAGGYLGFRRLGQSAGWVSGLVLILIGAFETLFR